MEDTLTLNNGVADATYTKRSTDNGTVTWTGTSAQADVEGTPVKTRGSKKSRNGILTTSSVTTVPFYNAGLGKYEGFIQARVTLTRPSTVPIADADKVLDLELSSFNVAKNATYTQNVVGGNDAY